MANNQDLIYLKVQMGKGLSYDEAYLKLKSVKAKMGSTTSVAPATPMPEGKTMTNAWGETGAVPSTVSTLSPLQMGYDLAKGAGQAFVGATGAAAEAVGKGAEALGANKIGGFLQEQGQGLQDLVAPSEDASLTEKAGRAVGGAAFTGAALANPLSGGLRTLGAKGAEALGGGKLAQLVSAGLLSSPVDTTVIKGTTQGELPNAGELAAGATIDVAFPVLGEVLKGAKGFAGTLYNTFKTKGQPPMVIEALKEAGTTKEAAKEMRDMIGQYAEHAKRPAEVKSPLALKAQAMVDDYHNILIPEQKRIGAELAAEAKASTKKFEASTPYEMFKKYLEEINVGVNNKYFKGGELIPEDQAVNLIRSAEGNAVEGGVNIEKEQMQSYLEPYAKVYKQTASKLKGFDSLDLRSAIEKVKTMATKSAQKFYEIFKGLDGVVGEYKQFNPTFSGSTDDLFDEIKSFSKASTSKVKDGVKMVEDLDVGNSIIQFTKDDQNVLKTVFETLKGKAERGEKLSLEDVWNLARSLEALSGVTPKNMAAPVTEAALLPVKALDKFVRKAFEDNLSDTGKGLYEQYAKLAPIRSIISKNIGDFGEGGEALLKSVLGSSAKGGKGAEALAGLGELTGKNYLKDIQSAAAAEILGGNESAKSIVRGLSVKGTLYGAVEDAVMNKNRLVQQLDDLISGEAKKLNVSAGAMQEATKNILKWMGLEILD